MKLDDALNHPDPEVRRDAQAFEWEIAHGRCYEVKAIDGAFFIQTNIKAFLMPWWKRIFYMRVRTNILAWFGDQWRRLACRVRILFQDLRGLKNPYLRKEG